jgi:hypothetical protein
VFVPESEVVRQSSSIESCRSFRPDLCTSERDDLEKTGDWNVSIIYPGHSMKTVVFSVVLFFCVLCFVLPFYLCDLIKYWYMRIGLMVGCGPSAIKRAHPCSLIILCQTCSLIIEIIAFGTRAIRRVTSCRLLTKQEKCYCIQ